MSVYHSSFNYLGINSRLKNLIIAHFDADNGEEDAFLNLEPIYTDSSLGLRRYDYGAKYGSVATFRITVVKPDGSDFSVAEVRGCLKWLTGTYANTKLELLVGEQIKCSFSGRFTNVWQQKMDARTVGLILEFTNDSPFAYSPMQTFSRTINGSETFKIKCSSDDLFSYVYLKTTYKNESGSLLSIENITVGEKTTVSGLKSDEIITINSPMTISSDKQEKTFGNTFNFVFPKLKPGINEIVVKANGPLTFEYIYPIKIGNVAVDIEELNGAIDCESNPGPGVVVTEHTAWENIWNKPNSLSGYGIKDAYNKDEINSIIQDLDASISDNLMREIESTESKFASEIEKTNSTLNLTSAALNEKVDAVAERVAADIENIEKSVYTKEEIDEKVDMSAYATKKEVSASLGNYYTKTELDAKLEGFVSDDVYTKTEVYNKSEIDEMLENIEVDVTPVDTYSKSEIDEMFTNIETGGTVVDTYTKSEIDEKLKNITASGVDISEIELDAMLTEVLG